MSEEKKPVYPKTRWNYDRERWETKANKSAEWSKAKDANPKFIETADFVKMWKGAKSIAEIGRRLNWPKSKVKGTRTRINNQIKKASWFSAYAGTEKAKQFQLQDLPEFTNSQMATATQQASEGFATNADAVMAAFMTKQEKLKFGL